MEFETITKINLSVDVADQIERKILSGEIEPGSRLPPEPEFAKILGVSRNVLRESLALIQERGFLDKKAGSGTHIQKPSSSVLNSSFIRLIPMKDLQFEEFFEVRALLEKQAAFDAASRITGDELEILKASLKNMEKVKTSEEWDRREYTFHKTISKASGNRLLYILFCALSNAMHNYFKNTYPVKDKQESAAAHRMIFNALEKRNPEKAYKAMDLHMTDPQKPVNNTVIKNVARR
jgi:GntR family transcriptional repressor for pyruvate dehydrogenase complex